MKLRYSVACKLTSAAPSLLRRNLERILKGSKSLSIDVYVRPQVTKRVNRIDFDCASDSCEDIANAAARVMQSAWESKADESIRFRLIAPNHPPHGRREYFVYTWTSADAKTMLVNTVGTEA